MKKTILSLVFIGAVGAYIFFRSPATSSASIASTSTPSSQTATVAASSSVAQKSAPPSQSATSSATAKKAGGSSSGSAAPKKTQSGLADGTYTGPQVNAYYGYVKVQATVQSGKVTNVKFLEYPYTHPTSRYINQQAMPMLTQEALSVQSANVNIISGATMTSLGFRQSLAGALKQAGA